MIDVWCILTRAQYLRTYCSWNNYHVDSWLLPFRSEKKHVRTLAYWALKYCKQQSHRSYFRGQLKGLELTWDWQLYMDM